MENQPVEAGSFSYIVVHGEYTDQSVPSLHIFFGQYKVVRCKFLFFFQTIQQNLENVVPERFFLTQFSYSLYRYEFVKGASIITERRRFQVRRFNVIELEKLHIVALLNPLLVFQKKMTDVGRVIVADKTICEIIGIVDKRHETVYEYLER